MKRNRSFRGKQHFIFLFFTNCFCNVLLGLYHRISQMNIFQILFRPCASLPGKNIEISPATTVAFICTCSVFYFLAKSGKWSNLNSMFHGNDFSRLCYSYDRGEKCSCGRTFFSNLWKTGFWEVKLISLKKLFKVAIRDFILVVKIAISFKINLLFSLLIFFRFQVSIYLYTVCKLVCNSRVPFY